MSYLGNIAPATLANHDVVSFAEYDDSQDGVPGRGIIIGLALALPLWGIIGLTVVSVLRMFH
jgi:hypothetical protein